MGLDRKYAIRKTEENSSENAGAGTGQTLLQTKWTLQNYLIRGNK